MVQPVEAPKTRRLGATGYLAVFAASIAAVMIAPAPQLPWAAGGCLLVSALLYPGSFRGLMRFRWLAMIALLAVPAIFVVGEYDSSLAGIPYSSAGLSSAAQIALRMVVVLVAVQGFASSVDISTLAGLLERAGLHGLGFAVGVAVNLLPALGQSAQNAWRSLWMRGGLRAQRWRALRLLAVTVLAGALSRAEEIALAAEIRAFTPERARSLPVRIGKWDGIVALIGLAGNLLLALLP